MGDSGSRVIGLTTAASAWRRAGRSRRPVIATLIIPLLVLAIPILDTALVTAVRLVEGRPIHQGGRDHASPARAQRHLGEGHRRPADGDRRRSRPDEPRLLGSDNGWVTLVGVLVTFALLASAGGLPHGHRRGGQGGRRQPCRLRQDPAQPATARRGRRRLRADLGLVHDRIPAVRGRVRNGLPEAHLPRLAAGDPRRPLPLLHTRRALQRCLALRRARARPRPSSSPSSSRRAGLRVVWFTSRPFGDFRNGSTYWTRSSRWCSSEARASPNACCSARTPPFATGTTAAYAARRRGPQRAEPVARATGDAGRAGRGLRGRRPPAARPPHAGRARARHAPGDRPRPRPVAAGPRARDDPRRARDLLDEVVRACERAQVPCRFVRRDLDLDPVIALGAAVE